MATVRLMVSTKTMKIVSRYRLPTFIFMISSLTGCAPRAPVYGTTLSDIPGWPPVGNRAIYAGTVRIHPDSGLEAHWQISYFRPAQTDSVVFLLNSGFNIRTVVASGMTGVSLIRDNDVTRIIVHMNRSPAGIAAATIDYTGMPLFGSDSINSMSPSWIELGLDSFWLPVLSDFSHTISGGFGSSIDIRGAGWKAAASGVFNRWEGDTPNGRVVTFKLSNQVPLIDIAFASSPSLDSTSREKVTTFFRGNPPIYNERVPAVANRCATYLDRYGSSGKLPPIKLVLAPRSGPGYARKNYIVISKDLDTTEAGVAHFVCHELAHFWSSGAVSNGPENWLNEAFAEFIAARYIRAANGDSAYRAIVRQWEDRAKGQPAVWTPTATKRPTARTAYGKAPFILNALEDRVGSPTMDRILTRFMTENIRTTSALLQMIGEAAGAETRDWFAAELAKPS